MLELAVDNYDEWKRFTAVQMAIISRVLLYDKSWSRSLFSHIGEKDKLFFDSALEKWTARTGHSWLTTAFIGDIWAREIPILDRGSRNYIPFEEWWNNIIIEDLEWNNFSRGDLILKISHKDGGGHVDSSMPQDYYNLTRNNSLWHMVWNDTSWDPVKNISYIVMRQIAHEILKTNNPDYISEWEIRWANWYVVWFTVSSDLFS